MTLRERLEARRAMIGNLNHLCLTQAEALLWADALLAAERRREALHLLHTSRGVEAMGFYCDRVMDHDRELDAALAAIAAHLEQEPHDADAG